MEARYNEASQSLTNEIILVESSYLDAIESANHGYNDLLAKDWISAIQSFAKAVDTLNLVKAQAAEIVAVKVRNAYSEFEAGKLEDSAKLFNEVLVIHPDQEEAITGLQLIKAEEDYGTPVLEAELVESNFEGTEMSNTLIPTPEEIQGKWEKSEHPTVVEADRHFDRRELKESLALYVELRAKEPSIPGLDERISLNRKVLRNEELIRLMDKGAILVELGQWTGAIKTYRHILNVDPVHKEARRGWEEALVSLVAQEQVEQYKDLIRHHLNARQFSHAGDVLVEARNVLHDRPDFDQLFLTVSSELANQQTPVDLVIGSDGETWVSIPGKMAPERFTEKEITIFPGKLHFVGWKKGFENVSVSLAFSPSDIPESVSVTCKDPIEFSDYVHLNGHDRVKTALDAFDLSELLADVKSFSAWVRMNGKMDGLLDNELLVDGWDRSLFSKVYAALSQQAEKVFALTHLDTRGHFLKVPDGLSRKETIELGQYLASLE
jgi:tetratricopeptide (TPR) repeat protein